MENLGFCPSCGTKLVLKHLENEGEIPFCETCNQFRFRTFSTAISAIVYNTTGDKVILIQQYGRKQNILVAGYVTLGESVETTLCREIKEELGLDVVDFHFNSSEYFAPSNTLMVNFACRVSSDELTRTNEEIDYINWYTAEEARAAIKPDSLAQRFLLRWFDKNGEIYPSNK